MAKNSIHNEQEQAADEQAARNQEQEEQEKMLLFELSLLDSDLAFLLS